VAPTSLMISSHRKIRQVIGLLTFLMFDPSLLLNSARFTHPASRDDTQIFYESVNGKDLWYDPVFRVECLDGTNVWCKVSLFFFSPLVAATVVYDLCFY